MAQSSIIYYHNFWVPLSHYYKNLKITLIKLSTPMPLVPAAMIWRLRRLGGMSLLTLLQGEP